MKWILASDRLPGINKVVKWRNGAGGNIPLGENTFLDQYKKVGPNTSWHEWLDQSPSAPVEQEGQEEMWEDVIGTFQVDVTNKTINHFKSKYIITKR